MKNIVEHLKKAELYEKALEIFNQMKDLFENVLYDFDAISHVLVSLSFWFIFNRKSNRRSTKLCLSTRIGITLAISKLVSSDSISQR